MSSAAVVNLFGDEIQHRPVAATSRFEEFWSHYPKRIGKPLAKAKYDAIVRGIKTKTVDKDAGGFMEIELQATEEELIEGAKKYTRSLLDMNTFKRTVEDKYLPAPAVWLNQGRWLDL